MTEKIRDSFIFYRSFYQSAKKLPKEDKAELFDAICSYALDGEEIDLSVVPEAIFTVIQPNLDANRRRWENGCKEKKQTVSKPEAKDKQTVSKPEGNKDKDKDVKCKLESQFESLWKLYNPIHTSKGSKQDARMSFLKAIKNSSFEEIENGLKNYMSDCHSKNSYTKQVVVWLNKKGWLDEYQNSTKSNTNDPLVDFINNLMGDTLITKIIISASNKAQIWFNDSKAFDKYQELSSDIKTQIKDKITIELGTTGFEPKF